MQFFSTRTWVNDAGGTLPPRYDFSGLSNHYNPSDHWPLLVDFKLKVNE